MTTRSIVSLCSAMAALWAAGCATPGVPSSSKALRIGLTPNYPPIAFLQEGKVNGMEVDFGLMLGEALGRRVEFVTVPWKEQINLLQRGETDIIMSGVTKTKARGLKVAFSDPYLNSGLRALCRRRDAPLYDTPAKIKAASATIGVMPGTTADMFVQEYCPQARRIAVTYRSDVPFNLDSRDLDLFVDDGFAIAELYGSRSADLAALPMPLTTEEYAWAMRHQDEALREQVNRALAEWKADGRLQQVINRWLPYLKDLKTP